MTVHIGVENNITAAGQLNAPVVDLFLRIVATVHHDYAGETAFSGDICRGVEVHRESVSGVTDNLDVFNFHVSAIGRNRPGRYCACDTQNNT